MARDFDLGISGPPLSISMDFIASGMVEMIGGLAAALVLAAFGTEMLDGAGNLLFLRAVHPYERSEMTTVFVSYRDLAQLGPPAVCSVLLSLFALPSVFIGAGVMMLLAASLSARIPKRF